MVIQRRTRFGTTLLVCSMLKGATLMVLAVGSALPSSDVQKCPGYAYAPYTCNQDETHRVCAQLVDSAGSPLSWGSADFWDITGQKAFGAR